MGLIQYYQITCQPVNKAIFCITIIMPIEFCHLVSKKCIIVQWQQTLIGVVPKHLIPPLIVWMGFD